MSWSPDGKTIAFIEGRVPGTGDGGRTKEASIRLTAVGGRDGELAVLHEFHAGRRGAGIPTALFWLSKDKLGWATADESGCARFLQTGVPVFKAEPLASVGVELTQSRSEADGADDVYYDPDRRVLAFTGRISGFDSPRTSRFALCSYTLEDNALVVTPLPISAAYAPTVCVRRPTEDDVVEQGDTIYDFGYRYGDTSAILQTAQWDLSRMRTLWTRKPLQLRFPRPSPDGRMLAWIADSGNAGEVTLMLFNVASGSVRDLARFSRPARSESPVTGCPFCWSPKGDRIAYADGASIKFVNVPEPR